MDIGQRNKTSNGHFDNAIEEPEPSWMTAPRDLKAGSFQSG